MNGKGGRFPRWSRFMLHTEDFLKGKQLTELEGLKSNNVSIMNNCFTQKE